MSQMIKESEFASNKGFDDITKFKDGGVMKKILRAGKGTKPTEFAECEIQYIGYFTDGKVWANTYRAYEKSVTFQMKKNKVIYGWEIACMSMKKGEKARFKISSAYAYGANGSPPNIPPDTNLVFDIELVEWKSMRNRKDKFMEKTSQSYEELVQGAEKEKEAGNELFKNGEFHEAIERYQEAIQYARFVYEPKLRHTTRPIMLACELNKAYCYLKLKNWREVIKSCDEALKMDAHEPKAYFRKAIAHRMLGQDAEAKKNVMQAKRLCSDDPAIDKEITLIEWQWDQRKKREKKIFVNLFQEDAYEEPLETALVQSVSAAGPVRFKEDKAKVKKVDHVSLPGEDDALSKWGGGGGDVALPRGGDFKFVVPADETKDEGKTTEDADGDEPPPLEATSDKIEDDESDEPPPLEATSDKIGDDDFDDLPPLEPIKEDKGKATQKSQPAPAPAKVEQKKQAPPPQQAKPAEPPKTTPAPVKSTPAVQQQAVKQPAPAAKENQPQLTRNDDDDDDDYVYDNSVTNPSNPLIFFNLAIDNAPAGKVIVELFQDRVPKSTALFRKLCEKGYQGTSFHRLIPDYIIQGGDAGPANFTKERLDIPMDQEGLLCLAAPGSSQFFFTLVDCSHLNGQYVVIGKVIEGIEILLEDLASVGVANDAPVKKISIRSAGDFDLGD